MSDKMNEKMVRRMGVSGRVSGKTGGGGTETEAEFPSQLHQCMNQLTGRETKFSLDL